MKLLPSVPKARGIYELRITLGFSRYALALLDRHSFGRYTWPIRADNDRDHLKW